MGFFLGKANSSSQSFEFVAQLPVTQQVIFFISEGAFGESSAEWGAPLVEGVESGAGVPSIPQLNADRPSRSSSTRR